MISRVKQFATERGIDTLPFDPRVETINPLEELFESFYLSGKDPRECAEKTYEFMLTFGKPKEITKVDDYLDRLDAVVYILTGLMKLGVDIECAFDEVLKEIESRRQDPKQAEDWAKNGRSGKWQRDKSSEGLAAMYKANFENCKKKDKS